MTIEEIIMYLEKNISDIPDEFDESEIDDWVGGNIDDAYSMGYEHGSSSAYSDILNKLKQKI